MTAKQFAALQVGDQVRLLHNSRVYGFAYPTSDGRAYIVAGTIGTVVSTKVPMVRGPEGYFHCVDFPPATQLIDERGKDIQYPNPHTNTYRVACIASMIEHVGT